ncbi:MAG: hypothetical protein U5K30_01470 [Acidimicrobiales bacterium]|nr:hypothetical protein [Acidimicrobiales bacterium]
MPAAIASMAEDEDDATELAGTFSDDGMEDPRAMADRLLGGF